MPMLEVKRINPEMFAAWSSQPEDLCFSLPVAPAWLLIILPFFFCSKVASVQLYSPQSYLQRKGTQPHSDHPSLTLHPSVYSSMGCVEKARHQLSSTWWPESNITSPRPKSQFPITESPADTEYTPSDQKSTCHLSSCMGAQIPCTTYTVSLLGIQFLLPYSFLGYLEAEYVFLGWRQSTFYFQ